MADGKGFIIDAKIIICFPIDGQTFCVPDSGIHILKQQKLPVCSKEFFNWIKGKLKYQKRLYLNWYPSCTFAGIQV